jgi:lactate dehydrogenase-like 2-hydroxyacid dehydrogenase
MPTDSPPRRIKVYLARRLPPAVEALMRSRYDVKLNEPDSALSAEELIAAARGCEYLVLSVTEKVTTQIIRGLAPTLRLIATYSVGVDHIDLDATRAAGVQVLYSPNVLSAACAEIALLLILNAARRGYEADTMVRTDQWPGFAPTQLLGLGLVGRRLGILGMGRIGREVAARAKGFGMQVHYYNRRQLGAEDEQGATYHESSDELLAHSDILCLCLPNGAEVTGFLDARRINLLPANPIVVNIARGTVVDDDALIAALQSGRVFAAGLDVFANEPAVDPRYRSLKNVFMSPHIGSATVETRDAMGFLLLEGMQAIEEGRPPVNHFY